MFVEFIGSLALVGNQGSARSSYMGHVHVHVAGEAGAFVSARETNSLLGALECSKRRVQRAYQLCEFLCKLILPFAEFRRRPT